jgi:hypothetical protein
MDTLQLKLIENKKQIENMVGATFDTIDVMQMIDVTCDTNNLMVYTDTRNNMIEDSITSHEMY